MLSSLVKEHQSKQSIRRESQGIYFIIFNIVEVVNT